MTRMIPSLIDDSTKSSGERRVFELLRESPGTENWIVMHSQGLAYRLSAERNRRMPQGEIDFVVIVPGEGIICLEVKGGRVSSDGDSWFTRDRFGDYHRMNKSPFMQARDAQHSLRNFVIKEFGEGSDEAECPFGYMVVFPDVECPPVTTEFLRTEVIDTDDLDRSIADAIRRYCRQHLRGRQRRGSRLPRGSEVSSIRDYLRPSFEMVIAKSALLRRTDEKLLGLTKEQYFKLDELENNVRCFFEGAAGTGKTLLAMEYARRSSLRGAKVLFLCYNRLLGDWLQQQIEGASITAGTFHSFVRGLIMKSSVRDEFLTQERKAKSNGAEHRFFREEYSFWGRMALDEIGLQYDVLVVDEAQDIFDEDPLEFFDDITVGGLRNGRWAMFGDFTRQALYDSRANADILAEYCDNYTKARLLINCRNTKRIATEISRLSGFNTPPFRLMSEEGEPVDYSYYRNAVTFADSLESSVSRMLDQGISPQDIVLLSPRRLENSSVAEFGRIAGIPVADCAEAHDWVRRTIKFSTIHSFKGLESQVVILVDIDDVDSERAQALLYVGMSRARSLLILIVDRVARTSIQQRIRAAIKQEMLN